jgi:hypothetical protein
MRIKGQISGSRTLTTMRRWGRTEAARREEESFRAMVLVFFLKGVRWRLAKEFQGRLCFVMRDLCVLDVRDVDVVLHVEREAMKKGQGAPPPPTGFFFLSRTAAADERMLHVWADRRSSRGATSARNTTSSIPSLTFTFWRDNP